MNKHSIIALTISFLIAIVGLICGLETNGNNFARSGSLIVVIGIVLGLFDIPSRLNSVDLWAKAEAEKIKEKIMEENIQNGMSREKAEESFDKAVNESVKEIKKLAKKKKFRLMAVEAFILSAGTLIWGFGDLINPKC